VGHGNARPGKGKNGPAGGNTGPKGLISTKALRKIREHSHCDVEEKERRGKLGDGCQLLRERVIEERDEES